MIFSTDTASAGDGAVGLLMVEVAGERYGVPSDSVREVVRYRPWTIVPGAPLSLPGIISQRGVILPIVDLRALLNLAEVELAELGRAARFVVVQHTEVEMALLVERVFDLVSVEVATVEMPVIDARRGRCVRGLAHLDGYPIGLLDLDAMISLLREGS